MNPSNEDILCESCIGDYNKRKQNYEAMTDVRVRMRSYQVLGLTKPFNQFEWEKTTCNNQETCWGPAERIFEVRQKSNNKMHLIHYKIRRNQLNEEVVNRIYLNMTKRDSEEEHIFTSIGSCSDLKSFFWPDLFKHSDTHHQKRTYYFYVSIIPRRPVPHLKDVPIVWWPNKFKTPDRIYPMTMNFYFYEANLELPFPKTFEELEMNHSQSHLTFLEMYEGGAGLKVSQYKWRNNDSFEREDPLPFWTDRRSSTDLSVALYENKFRPRWINTHQVQEQNCYIKNYQNGFSGPVVSFWARLNSFNAWFS